MSKIEMICLTLAMIVFILLLAAYAIFTIIIDILIFLYKKYIKKDDDYGETYYSN